MYYFRNSSSELHSSTVLKSIVLRKKLSTVYQGAAGKLAFYLYCFVKLVQSKIC